MLKHVRRAATAAALLLGLNSVSAEMITLDLSHYGPLDIRNLVISGFNVSPRCHFDGPMTRTGVVRGGTVTGVGTDFGGNCGGQQPPAPFPPSYNPNYLGAFLPTNLQGMAYIDRGGAVFDLVFLDHYYTEFSSFASSNGGFVTFSDRGIGITEEVYRRTFSGPQWENITWFTFNPGNGPGIPSGVVGNVTLGFASVGTVPEPSSLLLFASALALAGAASRRRSA